MNWKYSYVIILVGVGWWVGLYCDCWGVDECGGGCW